MPEEVVNYIIGYGYLAIFILVFLQEIGMPNPFPNELLLIFSGYLSFKGFLFFPVTLLTAITADFIGTSILYFLFLKAGTYIIRKKPGWIPLSTGTIDRLAAKVSKGFVFRNNMGCCLCSGRIFYWPLLGSLSSAHRQI